MRERNVVEQEVCASTQNGGADSQDSESLPERAERLAEHTAFKIIGGFLDREEPAEETYFAYSASQRIFGDIPDLEGISNRLQLCPKSTHRKGDRASSRSRGFTHDMWSYSPSLAEFEPLVMHIDALWSKLKPHKHYLLALKRHLTVDVFLGYRSNCDHAGIEIPHKSLEMFTELQIPFGISIVIA